MWQPSRSRPSVTFPFCLPTFSFTGFESFAHVFNRHPLIQVLPSGFYSVFFSLNKTESPCQLGTGLVTEVGQCAGLAWGQPRVKCPMPLGRSGRHHTGGGRGLGRLGWRFPSLTPLRREDSAAWREWDAGRQGLGTCHCLPLQVRRGLGLEKQSCCLQSLTLPEEPWKGAPSGPCVKLLLCLLANS